MRLPRLMIAAPKSGSGKTLITCGLLEALKRRGVGVRSYKCGPDYIDPMFHRSVIGIPGGNLDTFFSSEDEIRETMAGCGSEAAVIEGVAAQCVRLRAASDPETLTASFAALFGSLRQLGETDLDGYLEAPIPIRGVLGDSHGALFGHNCRNGRSRRSYP